MSLGHRPTPPEIEAARLLLAPWRWLTAPRFEGLEHVPADRPFLLAGNHTLMGVLDAPLMVLGLYERRGVFVRALGDHLHFQVPVWRDLLERFGVVDGTPEAVHALMVEREPILVFPGGAREVFKRKGEQYRLLWGKRTGFARLAIEHGYPIVPFAAVGAEDAFDILLDADELLASPLGPLIRQLAPRADAVAPVVRGLGPTMLPRPERFYFRFAEPVETTPFAGRAGDPAVCTAVRDDVRRAVEAEIATLLLERERDPDRAVLPRMIDGLGRRRRRREAT
jgi:1-acyl-sn-glycerol-3-phosphate acyltransferase